MEFIPVLKLVVAPFDNHAVPQDQPTPPGGFGIDPGLGAATTRVPTASMEDSCPQATLKFQPGNRFDYIQGPPQAPANCML